VTEIHPDLLYLDLCFHYETDSHEELESIVEHLSGITPPENLSNQSVNVDLDNLANTEISFSTDSPLYPQDYDQSSFILRIAEETDYVHAHVYSNNKYVDTMYNLLEFVLRGVGPTQPTDLNIVHSIEQPVSELGVGSSPDDTQLSGVRFYENDEEFIFGEVDSTTSVRCDVDITEAFSDDDLQEEVEEHISRTESKVMGYINGV
jgi:hypothetical protein